VKVVLFIFVFLDYFGRFVVRLLNYTKSLSITFTLHCFELLDMHFVENSRQNIVQKQEN
jgi:hypothetical protein